MKSCRVFNLKIILLLLALSAPVHAALIVDSAKEITHQVKVQVIQVSDSDGSNTANVFGNASQQAEIESYVDIIWAQAGIDIEFLNPIQYHNTFANQGTTGNNNPRPVGDLNTMKAEASINGVLNADPLILNMFFVEVVPGFPQLSDNFANGLAFLGANGIAQHVGDNLPTFTSGREAAASVVAHEIAHNLGLSHIVESFNLLQEGGAANQGEILNTAQINIALASAFSQELSTPVPEPKSMLLLASGLLFLAYRRRKLNR